MAFELFTSFRSPTSEPFISVGKEGFRLSAGFVREYRLERAAGVRLYVKRSERAIGFHFPAGLHRKEGTLALKRHAGGFAVRAKGFFRSQGIDPARDGGRYQPREVKDRLLKKLFVIRLRSHTSRRRGKSKI